MSVSEIRDALKQIRKRVETACRKVGRKPAEIEFVLITRNRTVPEIRDAVIAGCRHFGENRVQEAVQKLSFFDDDVKWHLVGHLQSVKTNSAVQVFYLMHTVDGMRIGYDLQRSCEKKGCDANILIQVNTTDDDRQFGVYPSETINLIMELIKFPQVHIRGLMTEFPPCEDPEEARPRYRMLKSLSEEIRSAEIPGVEMNWLCMGSWNDIEVAVEEGSNILRITDPIFPDER